MWLGWLESGSLFCGALVVLGLALESGPEIVNLLRHHIPLPRPLWGDALVTVGVFGEVAIGLFIARSAKRQEIESATQIAELNAETARLRNETAEANLARAKIEQQMSARAIAGSDHVELKKLLAPHAGKLVDIVVFDHHIFETLIFANQIFSLFVSSGWKGQFWESRKAKYRIVGPSVIVAIAKGHEKEYMDLGDSLARALRDLGIDCAVRLSSFGLEKGKQFEPDEFQLTSVQPLVVFGVRTLSPFRIQIGAKQLAIFPPRPVTPPQA